MVCLDGFAWMDLLGWIDLDGFAWMVLLGWICLLCGLILLLIFSLWLPICSVLGLYRLRARTLPFLFFL